MAIRKLDTSLAEAIGNVQPSAALALLNAGANPDVYVYVTSTNEGGEGWRAFSMPASQLPEVGLVAKAGDIVMTAATYALTQFGESTGKELPNKFFDKVATGAWNEQAARKWLLANEKIETTGPDMLSVATELVVRGHQALCSVVEPASKHSLQ